MNNEQIASIINALIPALLVGLFTVAQTYLNNKHNRELKEVEWKREKEKIERDEKQAEITRELQQKKEERKELLEIYSNSISSISNLIRLNQDDSVVANEAQQIAEASANASKWIAMLLINFPKERENWFHVFQNHIENMTKNDIEKLISLRDMTIQVASEDKRLK